MKILFLIIGFIIISCSNFLITEKYIPNEKEIKYLTLLYGEEKTNIIKNAIYKAVIKNKNIEAGYDIISETIFIDYNCQDTFIPIIHESVHFYQIKYLNRSYSEKGNYGIPKNLTNKVSLEEEACLVSLYVTLLNKYNDDDKDLKQYIITFMHLLSQ